MKDDLSRAVLTGHAVSEMERRSVSELEVRKALAYPKETFRVRMGRIVVQSAAQDGYILRVFVDVDRSPPEVVTVYRTSKIGKYSRQP
jgi:hypothetical protein